MGVQAATVFANMQHISELRHLQNESYVLGMVWASGRNIWCHNIRKKQNDHISELRHLRNPTFRRWFGRPRGDIWCNTQKKNKRATPISVSIDTSKIASKGRYVVPTLQKTNKNNRHISELRHLGLGVWGRSHWIRVEMPCKSEVGSHPQLLRRPCPCEKHETCVPEKKK